MPCHELTWSEQGHILLVLVASGWQCIRLAINRGMQLGVLT